MRISNKILQKCHYFGIFYHYFCNNSLFPSYRFTPSITFRIITSLLHRKRYCESHYWSRSWGSSCYKYNSPVPTVLACESPPPPAPPPQAPLPINRRRQGMRALNSRRNFSWKKRRGTAFPFALCCPRKLAVRFFARPLQAPLLKGGPWFGEFCYWRVLPAAFTQPRDHLLTEPCHSR